MTILHPGKVLLKQYMQYKKLSQNKLAKTIGVPPRRINEIILGKRAITADTALRLGVYFNNSASYWMHLQAEYDIELAKNKLGQRLPLIKSRLISQKLEAESQKKSSSMQSATQQNNPATNVKTIKNRLMR